MIFIEDMRLKSFYDAGWFFITMTPLMRVIASQITSLTIVYSNVYSDADQRKHQSSASLAFVGDRWIPRTNGQ